MNEKMEVERVMRVIKGKGTERQDYLASLQRESTLFFIMDK